MALSEDIYAMGGRCDLCGKRIWFSRVWGSASLSNPMISGERVDELFYAAHRSCYRKMKRRSGAPISDGLRERSITHLKRIAEHDARLDTVLAEVRASGENIDECTPEMKSHPVLGPVLAERVQLGQETVLLLQNNAIVKPESWAGLAPLTPFSEGLLKYRREHGIS